MAAPDRDESSRAVLVRVLSRRQNTLGVTVGPGGVWIALLLVAPLAFMSAVSFATIENFQIVWDPTLEHYYQLFAGGTTEYSLGPVGFQATAFEEAVMLSYAIAAVATVLCLVLAFPLAYVMARLDDRMFKITIYFVLLPFFTMYLVRAYSWVLMFGRNGVLNEVLMFVGFGRVGAFEYGILPVIVGLTHAYFPYMLVTLYASLDGLDFTLIEAARDLGASRIAVVKDHIIPLTLPGIVGGSLFVFVPSVGAFITPQILGVGKVQMIGILIESRAIGEATNPATASAASMVVVASIVVAMFLVFRYVSLDDLGGV